MKNYLSGAFALSVLLTGIASRAQNKAGLPQLTKDNISKIISLMTIEEKSLFVRGANGEGILPAGFTNAIPRLGIPAMALTDGPAGVRITVKRENDTASYYCTAFPVETMLASSWNTKLLYRVGEAIGNETLEYGADILLAPALNIHRNPLGGRNFEYYSEDPLVSGKLAAAMVNGVQSQGIGTSIKHFAANNQETNRFKINEIISERALREIYLQGFHIALQESQPWTVMSSYNKINGSYTSEREDLLNSILRKEWGFNGFVMSDWRGGSDVGAQMKAGNDLLMPGKLWQSKIVDSTLRAGTLDSKIVDENIARILKVLIKSPTFNHYRFSNNPDLKAHALISREAAQEGMVMLKNKNRCLPLSRSAKKIALFGNASYNLIAGGKGSGEVNKAYVISLATALKAVGYRTTGSLDSFYNRAIERSRIERKNSRSTIPEVSVDKRLILQQSRESDLALITLGRISGESNDRKKEDFELSAIETQLLKDVTTIYHRAGKKVVVVLNIGGVIETASWKDMPDAILLAWQPGQEGGYAIADVLTGKVNPSGKLATTFPATYNDIPSAANFPGIDGANVDSVTYEEGIYVGYRFYDTFHKKPSFEFGYGSSFTDFAYQDLKLSSTDFDRQITITVTIQNTGKVPGKEIVQLYLTCPSNKMDKPLKELKGFAKTKLLMPGEAETISFNLLPAGLASFDTETHAWIAEAGSYMVCIGASSKDIRQKGTFYVNRDIITEKVSASLLPRRLINELKPGK